MLTIFFGDVLRYSRLCPLPYLAGGRVFFVSAAVELHYQKYRTLLLYVVCCVKRTTDVRGAKYSRVVRVGTVYTR